MSRNRREETSPTLNGIDTDRLSEMKRRLEEDPSAGRYRFRASSRWVRGTRYRTQIRQFEAAGRPDRSRRGAFLLEADEPAALLGEDHGPSATEAVLHALASCIGTTLVFHAAMRGIAIRRIEAELHGEIDLRGVIGLEGAERNGYRNIHAELFVEGVGDVAELEELARTALHRSAVLDVLRNPVPVDVEVTARGVAEPAPAPQP